MATPEADATNIWVQLGGGAVGVLTFAGMIFNWLRGQKSAEEKPPASHMVMEAASLADMRPFLDRWDKTLMALDSIKLSQTEILAEMRLQSKEDRDRRDSEERDELLELKFQRQVDDALSKLRQKERDAGR